MRHSHVRPLKAELLSRAAASCNCAAAAILPLLLPLPLLLRIGSMHRGLHGEVLLEKLFLQDGHLFIVNLPDTNVKYAQDRSMVRESGLTAPVVVNSDVVAVLAGF